MLAIGEVFSKMAEDRRRETCLIATTQLQSMLESGTVFIRGFRSGIVITKIANEILTIDPMITPNDALIITNALADDECSGLLTLDHDILRSIRLERLMDHYGVKAIDPRVLIKGSVSSRYSADLYLPAETITRPMPPSPQHV